jgi:RNA polymerase sigma-70 factor (ECF subfamily)
LRIHVGKATASPQGELNDEELCDALAAGKLWAADVFYARVEETVEMVLYRVLGAGDAEREDLMQQSLEKIVSSVLSGRFTRGCSLKSWAALITQNVAFDALRTRARERAVLDRRFDHDALEVVATDSATPERTAEVRQGVEAVQAALAATKRERAEAVILHDLLGHELTEIARLTGVSPAAAQSRLVRGRRDVVARIRAQEERKKGPRRNVL